MEKETKRFGYMSQDYAAPRAESIEMDNEGVLCASLEQTEKLEKEKGTDWDNDRNGSDWDNNYLP